MHVIQLLYYQGIRIIFKIERVEKSTVGDKLANSHGGKGVITSIEKFENMPVTPWGQPVDIILNPIAIINRMNPSTMFEMYTGLIAKFMAFRIVESNKVEAMKILSSVYKILDRTKNQKLSSSIISQFNSMSESSFNTYKKRIIDNNYIVPIIIPPFLAPQKEQIDAALSIVGAETSYHLKLPIRAYPAQTLSILPP